MTTTIIENDTQVVSKPEEKLERDNLRHIVNPPANTHIWRPGMSSQDIVDIARVRRLMVRALCGTEFIPTRNPEDVDKTCDACLDIAANIMKGA